VTVGSSSTHATGPDRRRCAPVIGSPTLLALGGASHRRCPVDDEPAAGLLRFRADTLEPVGDPGGFLGCGEAGVAVVEAERDRLDEHRPAAAVEAHQKQEPELVV